MYRNSYKNGLLTVFYSAGVNPFKNWTIHRQNGFMKRIYEKENGMLIMEMRGLNATVHYISCPKPPHKTLGICMPIFNLLIRNLSASFSFEVTIMDSSNKSRRFRCANYLSRSSINFFETTIPLAVCRDWVLIYFNLAEFTRRCYCTDYMEALRIQINGNVHIRRIFFSDRVIEYSRLPSSYQLHTYVKNEVAASNRLSGRPPSPVSACFRYRTKRATICQSTPSISEVEVSTSFLDDAMRSGSQYSLNKPASSRSSKSPKASGYSATNDDLMKREGRFTYRPTTEILKKARADILPEREMEEFRSKSNKGSAIFKSAEKLDHSEAEQNDNEFDDFNPRLTASEFIQLKTKMSQDASRRDRSVKYAY